VTRGRHAARASRPAGLRTLLAGSLVALGGLTGLALNMRTGVSAGPAGPVPHVAAPRGRAAALASASQSGRVPAPLFLVIPAIGVRTRLVQLGTAGDGTLEVPQHADVAGWYTASARPGAIGPAVIAGHVDSLTTRGVFFLLRSLRPGDLVYVVRADVSVVRFAITAVKLYPKAGFPAAAVYGPVPYAAIRLITCGGTFDHSTGHYLSNVVAFGDQVGRAKPRPGG